MRCFLVFCGLLSFLPICAQTSDTVRVSDFDLKPNTFENSVTKIQKAIEFCKTKKNPVLVFQPGRYDIWPDGATLRDYYISNTSSEKDLVSKVKTIGLFFNENENLTIDANGALLMFHGKITTMLFDKCKNIVVKNLNEDFERPTMSEFQIVASNPDYIDVRINRECTYYINNGELMWYGEGWKTNHFHTILVDTVSRKNYYSNWSVFKNSKAVELSPGLVRFQNPPKNSYKVGDVLTVRDIVRDQVGVHIRHSKGVTFQNVSMRYMHGMGILSQFSENVTMNNVRCAPTRESGRRMASSADFMHFVGCSGLVKIENCYLDGAHDDNVNIHGIHLRITRQLSPNELVVKFMHHETYGFEAYFAGDEVEFINSKTLNSYAKNRVAKAEELNNFEIKLTLANSLPTNISPDDCLENVTRTPEVQIRNNRFGGTNTRGVLLTTRRKSVIENNIFFRTGMHAILISDDANSWYESGMVTDVTIRGNTFIDCAYKSSPRSIIAIIPENKELAKPVHSNIRIKNNTFKMAPGYLPFTAKSTQNIQFTGNSIENTDSLRNKEIIPITLNACRNVEIKGNKLLNFSDFKVTLENMSAD